MKTVLWILLGALIMFVILKVMSKTSSAPSNTSAAFKKLAGTVQVRNLIRTNEFRELIKTQEFKSLALSLADEQLKTLSTALVS
jgi:hypothetical protein